MFFKSKNTQTRTKYRVSYDEYDKSLSCIVDNIHGYVANIIESQNAINVLPDCDDRETEISNLKMQKAILLNAVNQYDSIRKQMILFYNRYSDEINAGDNLGVIHPNKIRTGREQVKIATRIYYHKIATHF